MGQLNLYELAKRAKKEEIAREQILELFQPKIKKTLLQTAPHHREDVEQELSIKLLNVITMYDLDSAVGFWEFHEMTQKRKKDAKRVVE
ncbi:helix-turn-helix domain-containing protein [Mesobacillus zeae]|uniref:Helix-turn-helix conjugative transposon-like domain-containing protein n=1 Tax=Mesobacillus zeae TaxID=1917180 RepID=A0A398B1Z9_9BACI|nr:helix-turn-helix domain-containing protein [Mesobacillus zeae]RID82918.1 hypothetical protein D1970_17655 [Mesobacillus zeae]